MSHFERAALALGGICVFMGGCARHPHDATSARPFSALPTASATAATSNSSDSVDAEDPQIPSLDDIACVAEEDSSEIATSSQSPTPLVSTPDEPPVTGVRLVARSCQQSLRDLDAVVERRVARMRAAVEAEWQEWKQQACYRPASIGGLGLVGIGAGGGGIAKELRSGSGFGSGHGRLGGSHSTTNNQIASVDEADIVKTDDAYLYLASGQSLYIIDTQAPRLVSRMEFASNVRELVVDGDRAVVFMSASGGGKRCTYGYDCTFAGDGSTTQITTVDISNRKKPSVVRQIYLSSSFITARRIGNTVHAFVAENDATIPYYPTSPQYAPLSACPHSDADLAEGRSRVDKLLRDNERLIRDVKLELPNITENGITHTLCNVWRAQGSDEQGFSSIVSFDMTDDTMSPTTVTMRSRPGPLFVSEQSMYLAVRADSGHSTPRWRPYGDARNEKTFIHRIAIETDPALTRYQGSGVIPGHVLNQFAMDESAGYLRVATSRGRVPNPDVESEISILAGTPKGNLTRIGAIEHIAPHEDIRSVRFDGDRAYVVTFKKTDPLFVVDLASPTSPRILGELKIPGFSTYLHRIDPTHLLSIGYDADDKGDFAYFDGLTLQMFDVTRPTSPTLLFKEKIGTRGSSSAAATDHHAFNYFAERNLLALPMTICEGGGNGRFGDRMTFSGLVVYRVSMGHGFRRLGGIDHGEAGASCNAWWSNASSVAERSVIAGDLVFSIARDRVKAQRIASLGKDVADIALDP